MLTLMSPGIEEYAQAKSEPAGSLLEELERQTWQTMPLPQMVTGRVEGRFLKLMVQISGARRVLEVGTFTGYSALSMAEGLPADGKLITLELDARAAEFARRYFALSEHGGKIEIKEGPALSTIKMLSAPFDLVFIDADKENYLNYYKACLPLLPAGGLVLVDNVLWGGAVLDPKDDTDFAIASFNDYVAADESVDRVLLTVRDGVYLIRKR